MHDPAEQPDALSYQCPHCGQIVSPQDPTQPIVNCPRCGQAFSIGDEQAVATSADADEEADARARAEIEARREADLSEVRIRQVAGLRRGAYRSRSWLLIGAFTCVVAIAQLIHLTIRDWRLGMRLAVAIWLVLLVAVGCVLFYFARRIRAFNQEIRQTKLPEPTTPPDFSTLSDGSQRWRNLEQLSGQRDEHP